MTDTREDKSIDTLLSEISRANAREGVEFIDTSTPTLLKKYGVQGPVCLLGAKTYKMTEDQVRKWREFYATTLNTTFTGIDIEGGLNVDVVADICDPDFATRHSDLCGRFGFVICGALLEHVKNPFAAASNIEQILAPGGRLHYVGPWVWGHHQYPDDYWRISFSGLQVLFPRISWLDWWYSGTTKNVGIKISLADERRHFQETELALSKLGKIITDRAMPYLNIGAIGSLRP